MKWHVREPLSCNGDSVYVIIAHSDEAPSHTLASFNRYEDAMEFLGSVIKNYIHDDWSLYREHKDDVVAYFHYVSPSYET